MIEEHGTTDYAGALLRCFVSQGVVSGQKVFVGAIEAWGANLPGVKEEKVSRSKKAEGGGGSIQKEVDRGEKMKIAWRYERLGVQDGEKRGACLMYLSCYYTYKCDLLVSIPIRV